MKICRALTGSLLILLTLEKNFSGDTALPISSQRGISVSGLYARALPAFFFRGGFSILSSKTRDARFLRSRSVVKMFKTYRKFLLSHDAVSHWLLPARRARPASVSGRATVTRCLTPESRAS